MATAPPLTSSSSANSASFSPPSSILIVGSGVFGLSTAWALARRAIYSNTSLTVVDRSDLTSSGTVFPARDASSIDSSRIIRPDYADRAYAALAAEAQVHWKKKDSPDDLGAQGRYNESGLVLVADEPEDDRPHGDRKTGIDYVRASWHNVLSLASEDAQLASQIRELPDVAAIRQASGTGCVSGSWGYINKTSGWAHAEKSMAWLYDRVCQTGRVKFVSGTVEHLTHQDVKITGVKLSDGRSLNADLVVLATGAWTGALVDFSGQATATGQVLGYMDITQAEQEQLQDMPIVLNLTTGQFIIPPRDRVLKAARHGFGYTNPTQLSKPPLSSSTSVHTAPMASQPWTHLDNPDLSIPSEGLSSLRHAVETMIPLSSLASRPFKATRLCWYTDTATGDFIITYHPDWRNLFMATGGSGHGFKFLPVIGEKIADCIEGRCPPEFRDKWAWKASPGISVQNIIVTEDGSRGGKPGLVLKDELSRPAHDEHTGV